MTDMTSGKEESLPHSSIKHQTRQSLQQATSHPHPHPVVINFNFNHLKMTPVATPGVTNNVSAGATQNIYNMYNYGTSKGGKTYVTVTSRTINNIAAGATQIVNQTISHQSINNNYSHNEKNRKVGKT